MIRGERNPFFQSWDFYISHIKITEKLKKTNPNPFPGISVFISISSTDLNLSLIDAGEEGGPFLQQLSQGSQAPAAARAPQQ